MVWLWLWLWWQVLEIYRQMKGLCGDYQMKKHPELGIAVNMGGDDKTIATMLLRNVNHQTLDSAKL